MRKASQMMSMRMAWSSAVCKTVFVCSIRHWSDLRDSDCFVNRISKETGLPVTWQVRQEMDMAHVGSSSPLFNSPVPPQSGHFTRNNNVKSLALRSVIGMLAKKIENLRVKSCPYRRRTRTLHCSMCPKDLQRRYPCLPRRRTEGTRWPGSEMKKRPSWLSLPGARS